MPRRRLSAVCAATRATSTAMSAAELPAPTTSTRCPRNAFGPLVGRRVQQRPGERAREDPAGTGRGGDRSRPAPRRTARTRVAIHAHRPPAIVVGEHRSTREPSRMCGQARTYGRIAGNRRAAGGATGSPDSAPAWGSPRTRTGCRDETTWVPSCTLGRSGSSVNAQLPPMASCSRSRRRRGSRPRAGSSPRPARTARRRSRRPSSPSPGQVGTRRGPRPARASRA